MKYQAYYKGSKVKVPGWVFEMPQADPLHRKEVVAWLNSISDPSLDGTYYEYGNTYAHIIFEAPPSNIAEYVAKTCVMAVVRDRGKDASQIDSRPRPSAWKTKTPKGLRWNFPYRFEHDKTINDSHITMPFNEISTEANWYRGSWISGECHKDISRLYTQYLPRQRNNNFMDEWDTSQVKQFYIGIVYFDENQKPSIFKMFPFNVEV